MKHFIMKHTFFGFYILFFIVSILLLESCNKDDVGGGINDTINRDSLDTMNMPGNDTINRDSLDTMNMPGNDTISRDSLDTMNMPDNGSDVDIGFTTNTLVNISTHDFGTSYPIGSNSKTEFFRIANNRSTEIEITEAVIEGTHHSAFQFGGQINPRNIEGLKGVIAAGSQKRFHITFIPPSIGTGGLDINVTVTCTERDGKRISMTLRARTDRKISSNQRLYVDVNASGDNDGTSWQNAYTDLNKLLSLIQRGGVQNIILWVAAGIYDAPQYGFEVNTRIKMYGGFAGNETSLEQRNWVMNKTILHGRGSSYHAVNIQIPGQGAERDPIDYIIIDGFEMTGGAALGTSRNNLEQTGGGLLIGDGSRSWPYYQVKINNVKIHGNKAAVSGSAIYCGHAPTIISNAIITENSSGADAGVNEKEINRLFDSGIRNTLIVININNSIHESFQAELINCTIAGNIKGMGTNVTNSRLSFSQNARVTNCIIWGENESFQGKARNSLLNYEDLDNGIIMGDPLLTEDFKLQVGSPAIGRGNNDIPEYIMTDFFGAPRKNGTIDIGAHESN